MNKKRILSLVAVAVVSVSVLAGCGSKNDSSALKDGKYEVESKAANDQGYKSTLTMEVKDGKISSVNYDELSDQGTSKKSDEAYNSKMKEIKGTNPSEAFPALEADLLKKQSAEVDAVTNATSSSNTFKSFAAKAIENAKAGNTEKALME